MSAVSGSTARVARPAPGPLARRARPGQPALHERVLQRLDHCSRSAWPPGSGHGPPRPVFLSRHHRHPSHDTGKRSLPAPATAMLSWATRRSSVAVRDGMEYGSAAAPVLVGPVSRTALMLARGPRPRAARRARRPAAELVGSLDDERRSIERAPQAPVEPLRPQVDASEPRRRIRAGRLDGRDAGRSRAGSAGGRLDPQRHLMPVRAVASPESTRWPGRSGGGPASNHTVIIEFLVDDWTACTRTWPASSRTLSPSPPRCLGNRSLLFRDPDGNLVNFFTPVTPSPRHPAAIKNSPADHTTAARVTRRQRRHPSARGPRTSETSEPSPVRATRAGPAARRNTRRESTGLHMPSPRRRHGRGWPQSVGRAGS